MPPLNPAHLSNAEHKRVVHTAYPVEGVTLEDVLKPDFWVHVAASLKVTDKIEVYPADMSWYAELVVLSTGNNHAKVFPVLFVEIGAKAGDEVADAVYEIKLRGPRKWSAVHRENGSILFENIDTREDAMIELAKHMKSMAA